MYANNLCNMDHKEVNIVSSILCCIYSYVYKYIKKKGKHHKSQETASD